jgi:hypothetical protein
MATTTDDKLAQLLDANAFTLAACQAIADGNIMLLAGTITDPESFDAGGGKAGPLGYYPVQNVSGQISYMPCLARMKADASAALVSTSGDYPLYITGSSKGGPGQVSPTNKKIYSGMVVLDDNYSQVANGANIGPKVDGWGIIHLFGGSNTRGGRHAVDGVLLHTLPTAGDNEDRNYVGIQGQVISVNGDGGIAKADGQTRGAWFGMSSSAILQAGTKNGYNVTACEFNTNTLAGCDVEYRSGIQIADFIEARGWRYDVALSISCLGGSSLRHQNAILIGSQNGSPALGPDSNVLQLDSSAPSVRSFLYAPNVSFSDSVIRTAGLFLNRQVLQLETANAGVSIGDNAVASTPFLQFRSSGAVGNGSDAKLTSIGGGAGGASGQAALVVQCGELVPAGTVRPASDNALDLGAGPFRFRNAYFANNPQVTSDARSKRDLGSPRPSILRALGKVRITIFQYLDAIADKGEDWAREHFGVIAQELIAALENEGEDAMRLGFVGEDSVRQEVDIYETVDVDVMEPYTEEDDIFTPTENGFVWSRGPVEKTRIATESVPVLNPDGTPRMVPARLGQPARPGHYASLPNGERVWVKARPEVPGFPEHPMVMDRPLREKKRVLVGRKKTLVLDDAGNTVFRYSVRYEQLAMAMIGMLMHEGAERAGRVEALEATVATLADRLAILEAAVAGLSG